MKRLINCHDEIVTFITSHLNEFHFTQPPLKLAKWGNSFNTWDIEYGEIKGSCFHFVKDSNFGSFYHLDINQGFTDGKIFLQLGPVYVSYIKYFWDTVQCTYKQLNNSSFSKLSRISPNYSVASPWFIVNNDKNELLKALEQLKNWCFVHMDEINQCYAKQQTKLDRECGCYRVVRNYVQEHITELNQDTIYEIYQCIDILADNYGVSHKDEYKKALSERVYFTEYCYKKLPPAINDWVENILILLKKTKGIDTPDFAICSLLYFVHDSLKLTYPNIIKLAPWKHKENKRI